MGRTGVAVDAAMFAALVRVDGPVETDVRTGVPRDDRPRVLGRQGGAQGRRLAVVAGPAVVEGLHDLRFEPPGRIRPRPPSLRRFSHGGNISPRRNKARTFGAVCERWPSLASKLLHGAAQSGGSALVSKAPGEFTHVV